VAWGELRRIDAGDGRMRFDPDVREHAEAICLRCHRIDDVPGSAGRPPLPPELAGYQIVRRAETFYGYCPACRAGDAQPADDVAADRA
jgi:Fe2+ or Zn2+ uptake regulation protein